MAVDTVRKQVNSTLETVATALSASALGATGDVHVPASNTAAVVTYAAAGSGLSHVLGAIYWSTSADPAAATALTVTDGGATIFSVDVTKGGPGFIPFYFPKRGALNSAMVITLAAPGSSVSGKVSCTHWIEG